MCAVLPHSEVRVRKRVRLKIQVSCAGAGAVYNKIYGASVGAVYYFKLGAVYQCSGAGAALGAVRLVSRTLDRTSGCGIEKKSC